MADEMTRARLADLVELVQAGMKSIARVQREQVRLTASASAAEKRVTVVVNANGDVIGIRFADTIDELTYGEIAQAVTEAAQAASREVRRKTQQLLDSLRAEQARMPKLSELMPGFPDVLEMVPAPPEVSTAPPDSPLRLQDCESPDDTGGFDDVEQLEQLRAVRSRFEPGDAAW